MGPGQALCWSLTRRKPTESAASFSLFPRAPHGWLEARERAAVLATAEM